MQLAQQQVKKKEKYGQMSKFRYYALVGSESSFIQFLISENKITIDQHNSFESVKEKIFTRIIIPKVNQVGFKIQVHISEYYLQLYPFRNAVFFISKNDFNSLKNNSRSKPLNVFKLLRLCIVLGYETINVVVENEQLYQQFSVIKNDILEDLKTFNISVVSKFIRITEQEFSISNISKVKSSENQKNYLQTNILVTKIIDESHVEIVVLFGVLFKGQQIWLEKEKVTIIKILSFCNAVSLALTNQIVTIIIDKKLKMEIGSVGCFTKMFLDNVNTEMTLMSRPNQKVTLCSDIHYQLVNWRKCISFEENKPKQQSVLTFATKKQLLSYNRFPSLISFSNTTSEILAIGTVSYKPELLQTASVFLMPITFLNVFSEECELKKKFIQRCRICKMEQIDCVLIPCGHLRYCLGCAGAFKNCHYCESEIKFRAKLNIQESNPQDYLHLTKGFIDEDYLEHTNYQTISPMIKFEIEQQQLHPSNCYKCQLCNTELFTHVLEDEQQNYKFVCNFCGLAGKHDKISKYKIQYPCL